jgi:transposase InsO family protein
VGDRVVFDGAVFTVVALDGVRVRIAGGQGVQVVLLSHLAAAPGFEVLDQVPAVVGGLLVDPLDDLPPRIAARAKLWERHVVEVETGLPPGSAPGAVPAPEFGPLVRLADRDRAKAAELSALLGEPVSARTVRRMRGRYREAGVRGLADARSTRVSSPTGRVDSRLVEVVQEAMADQARRSTGTRDRLRAQVERVLRERYGSQAPPMPSKATFNRLLARLDCGRHTFGAASTRRSLAAKPQGPYSVNLALRPGQHVHIDSTPLDTLALFDDGIGRRVDLFAAIDLATRTICAAVLRPVGLKAVDASLMLARMLVPEPMRPGWAEAAAITSSRLPWRSLEEIDARMHGAAAKPVIVPESIGTDRGKVYLSEAFLQACEHLGICLQPSRPRTSADNAVIERTFNSINTLFTQYVKGYVGRDPAHRGRGLEQGGLWSLAQLRDLLDQWVVLGWQERAHEGLASPDTGRVLSPNEMYGVLVSAVGYVPLMLSGQDYIALLPAVWRVVNDYGVNLHGRTYDAKGLNPMRRQHSGVTAKRGLWQVRYDPCDLSVVWVADHRRGGFLAAPWTHLPMAAAPFADYTWRHAQHLAASRDAGQERETGAARALADLLAQASDGPGTGGERVDRKIAARTRAAAAAHRPPVAVDLAAAPEEDFDAEDETELGTVIPFGIFDAAVEAERWR